MKFDDLDKEMRMYETGHDMFILPGVWMVARIDGRSFTRLTKEVHQFEAPFDPRFRDIMLETLQHLMACGFRVSYGYTQSDEISLLFHLDVDSFDRKMRKYNSVLAGEASAAFSLKLGALATFDCRISELPNTSKVRDYFLWRQEDASRNALNSHCYWLLRKEGKTVRQATRALEGASVADKNELLFQRGVNFSELPLWQRRGMGVYWEDYLKEGFNPQEQTVVKTIRRRLHIDMELPMKAEYEIYIDKRIMEAGAPDLEVSR
ncbi:MAG: tRNA(His) guanylyltransferase Thg1 family protein [Candidatus Methylacidiphilales bacterium]|nr:tRNA(His) guanylyltransferase Thg1 family protein [Candidatus Methylacidiphilales bacterium]